MNVPHEPETRHCHWCSGGTTLVYRDHTGHTHGLDNLGLPICEHCRSWLIGGAIGIAAGE